MQNILTKPLVYLLIASTVLFLLYSFVIDYEAQRASRNIVISAQQQANLANEFERSWQRPPTVAEMREVLDVFVRNELAYREANNLGLGGEDPDIRRRLQENLELLAAEKAMLETPTQEQLQTYLNEHAEEFRVDPLLTFRQIYFDNTNSTIGADASARFMLGKMQNQDMPEDISKLGDPSGLPPFFTEVQSFDIAVLLGGDFAARLAGIAVGEWVGPIRSNFGLHLVYVDKRVAGRIPELDEVEERVRREWLSARRSTAIDGLYLRLKERYAISIE